MNNNWFFEEINKIDKFLTEQIRKDRSKLLVSKRGKTTDYTDIQKLVWEYFEKLYANK